MENYEIYRDLYFHDFERRDEINNSITISYGALPILFAGGIALAKEIDSPFDGFELWSLVFLVLAFILLIFAFVYLTRAYIGYEYGYIPYAKELYDYQDNLRRYYVNSGRSEEDAEVIAGAELRFFLAKEYANYSERNQKNNDRKLSLRFKGVAAIVFSASLLISSGIPYALTSVTQTEAQKIEIFNFKEIIDYHGNPTKEYTQPD
ncbi:MAG: hypothetical protein RI925_2197 [Pseudomonadota bacterium]|jgi:hypothetical protein